MSNPEWTDEQMLAQARLNALGIVSTTMVYVKQSGKRLEYWAQSVGRQFAPGWDGLKGGSALDIAKAATFNLVSLGGTLVSLEGDEKQATAVFDYPIEETVNWYGVSVEDWDVFLTSAHKSIFAYLDIGFSSQRDGERWTYKLSY
jgi:hypothetical protein